MENNLNWNNINKAFETFHNQHPFNHTIVEDFFIQEFAKQLEFEFISYESPKWFVYKNQIEDKKALNDWNIFPKNTYQIFSYLNSPSFLEKFSKLVGVKLYPDPGLNGGGWHIHGTGGNLNPHLDYSIHPKLQLQRKVNIIIYLSENLKEEHGGHLGLWTNKEQELEPEILAKEITPKFNRAVIFDTTQNSWHGMSRPLIQPHNIYRKSLAIYYLCVPPEEEDINTRGRALFAARDEQKSDPKLKELIKARADVELSKNTYKNSQD